jgi:hypothetical protein
MCFSSCCDIRQLFLRPAACLTSTLLGNIHSSMVAVFILSMESVFLIELAVRRSKKRNVIMSLILKNDARPLTRRDTVWLFFKSLLTGQ